LSAAAPSSTDAAMPTRDSLDLRIGGKKMSSVIDDLA